MVQVFILMMQSISRLVRFLVAVFSYKSDYGSKPLTIVDSYSRT